MIIYSLTVNVDEDVLNSWLDWMTKKHIPDVLDTGLFIECKLSKILAEEAGGRSYSIQYLLNNWEDYNLYQSKYATNLQNEHLEKFGNKCVAFRTLLRVDKIFIPHV